MQWGMVALCAMIGGPTAAVAADATGSAEEDVAEERAVSPMGASRLTKGVAFVGSAENDSFDLFSNRPYSDRYYTHGTHLSVLTDWRPTWATELGLKAFPKADEIRISATLAQNIYTPRAIDLVDPSPEDRPYAGLLYVGVGLIGASDRALDTLEVRLGFVGPSSLAWLAQDTRHDMIHIAKAQGWHHQIQDEVVGSLAWEHRGAPKVVSPARWGPLRVERSSYASGELGTLRTTLGVGGAFAARLGEDRDYGPVRNWPGVSSAAFTRVGPRLFDATLFAGAELHGVLRDVTLDGGVFRDSARVDKRYVVGELQAGFAVRLWAFRLVWARVVQTPEFAGQGGNFHEYERYSVMIVPFRR